MSYILEAQKLRKEFGDFVAVDSVTIAIEPGEIVGFLGPNGAGKTTTMRMMTGLLKPTSGTTRIAGHDMSREPLKAKAQIGWAPATPNVYEKLTALEYLRFISRIYRVPKERAEPRIKEMLERFDLTGQEGTRLEGFSHGMRQKVAIIGAMLHEPAVMFMDEPTVGLDPKSSRTIKNMMRAVRDAGRSVMFSTHILEIAENLVDRVIIIDEGRIIARGTLEELRQQSDQGGTLEDLFLRLTNLAEEGAES